MLLNKLQLTEDPINKYVEVIRAQLEKAVDNTGAQKLNQSVQLGWDAVLSNALAGRPSDTACPCIRIFYDTNQREMQNEQGIVLFTNVNLYLYFIYYMGTESISQATFQKDRENHIRQNLDNIKYNSFSDGLGIALPLKNTWKYLPGTYIEDHTTPLKYLSGTMQLEPPYAASRMELGLFVKNY